MEDDVKTLRDYLSIAWRRKFYIIIPFILVVMVTVATVLLLPPVYRSSGTILIESQQIPEELVQSAITSFADERIQVIQQRIMTSQQLMGVIKKYDLYKDLIRTTARSEILADMRERVSIERVSADLGKKRKNKASALIAFKVSFDHSSPRLAQKVASELVTLFLDENIRSRTVRAEETSDFLKVESDRLGAQIAEMEVRIANYKEENEGSLPQSMVISLQRSVALRSSLRNFDVELNALSERKQLLQIDLEGAQYKVATGSSGLSNEEVRLREEQLQQKGELQELQNRFISLSARYGAGHPDVKSAQRQINAFEQEYGNLSDIEELRVQRWEVQLEISDLTAKYSSQHPDVKRLERELEGIDAMIEKSGTSQKSSKTEAADEQPVSAAPNTELMQIQALLESVNRSIERIQEGRIDIEKQIAELDVKISRTPQVERGLDALERDYDNTRRKYQEMKSKQLQAELSQSLEQNQKGERFTLLEPPILPDSPVKPDRPKLFMLGMMLAMVGGLGVAGLAESVDGGIRGSRALASVTKMTPLVTIPYITTRKDEMIKKRNLRIFTAVTVILVFASIAAVHFFYKPLDLLWFIVLREFNLT